MWQALNLRVEDIVAKVYLYARGIMCWPALNGRDDNHKLTHLDNNLVDKIKSRVAIKVVGQRRLRPTNRLSFALMHIFTNVRTTLSFYHFHACTQLSRFSDHKKCAAVQTLQHSDQLWQHEPDRPGHLHNDYHQLGQRPRRKRKWLVMLDVKMIMIWAWTWS